MSDFADGVLWGAFQATFLDDDYPKDEYRRTIVLADVVAVINDHLGHEPFAETLREVITDSWFKQAEGDQ